MDKLVAAITTPFVFAFGASIGSFFNVVVYRLPAQLSLLHPPSRCPHCLHPLSKQENIPVLGWLWLKGRCRWCKTPISIRYPLIEAATGLLFVLVFWQFGFHLAAIKYWVFLSWLVVLALIDLDTMTLPNMLTQSGLLLGLGFQVIKGWQDSQVAGHLMAGIGGTVLGIWVFDLILIVGTLVFQKPAMGGGDPKLAAMIGAWLGWKYVLLTGFLACAIGAFTGIAARLMGWLKSLQEIPFGPFLALGAALTVFWGDAIIATYLKLFFPHT
ncbi:MAG: prepilin peptidase [Microcystaceae cyanobacterium]